MENGVLILDFGSQYTQLIARRIRELGVYSEILPFNITVEKIRYQKPAALILSGGPASVYQKHAPRISKKILDLGLPVLGICYGLQLLAYLSGMKVEPANDREYGLASLKVIESHGLLQGIQTRSKVWMSHGDKITQYPKDFQVTGSTNNTEIAVIESKERRIYGVQFHPEVIHTEEGGKVLGNFLFHLCALQKNWNMGDFIKNTLSKIKKKIGKERIILGLSGGIDSTVLALLLKKAVGDQLIPVFVNTGMLRKNEYRDMMKLFKTELGLRVVGIDASKTFLKKLGNTQHPERKRKIIGKTFIDVFKQIEKKHGQIKFFAQGTLYPDVIESVSVKGPSATIKSHHNVGGLPRKINWTLIEPLRELFKDEVRKIGIELGLHDRFVNRHPFPGPGLAVRILGSVSAEKVKKLQEADAILIEELKQFKLYNQVWQAFVVLLPVKSVGVMGDMRTYENVAVIRIVESVDGMTADWFPAPNEFLKKVANRIVNEVPGINRVAYDLTSKPPGTIEWE